MDRKAIIVLVVSFLLLILWYPLVNRLYPPRLVPRNTNVVAAITNVIVGAAALLIVKPLRAARALQTPAVGVPAAAE